MNRSPGRIDWLHLNSFADICEYGSISAAARARGTSQPTLSRHIVLLEQSLGLVLLERGTTGVVPTPHGRALMKKVAAMQHIASSIQAGDIETSLRGVVRITASRIMANYALAPILPILRSAEPDLAIEVSSSDTTENLLRRDADIALRMARPKDNALIGQKLGDIDVRLFGAKQYLDARGRPSNAASLLGHTLIGYDRSSRLIEGFKKAGIDIDSGAFHFRSDDQVLCWRLISLGCGLGFAPAFLGDPDPFIERIDLPQAVGTDPVWLTAHNQLKSNPRIRRVFDFLAAHLPKVIFGCTIME